MEALSLWIFASWSYYLCSCLYFLRVCKKKMGGHNTQRTLVLVLHKKVMIKLLGTSENCDFYSLDL